MRRLSFPIAFALLLAGCSGSGTTAGSDDATVPPQDIPVTDDATEPPQDIPVTDDATLPPLDVPVSDDAVTTDQPTDQGPDSDIECVPSDHKACCGNAVCWFDSCGQAGDTVVECPSGCEDARCKNCTGSCTGRQCGGDGCGGDCGLCDPAKCAGLVWTEAQACVSGSCTGGGAQSCDDGEVCTDDTCDQNSGCAHVPNTAACDDGDPCTTGDLCSAGACGVGPVPLDCDDLNPCTRDSCVKGVGCKHPNEDDLTPCGDGACTGLMWTVARFCSGGICGEPGFLDCDDGVPCTVDACTPATGCTNTLPLNKCLIDGACVIADAADDGNDCRLCKPALDATQWTVLADGDPCGVGDQCYQGECGACVPACEGRNCGDDGCGGECGTCQAGACDQNVWFMSATCTEGTCVFPSPSFVTCDDGEPCTVDSCDAVLGCSHVPVQEGTECESARCVDLYWMQKKTCISGRCMGGGTHDCTATSTCFTGACDPTAGCSSDLNPGSCFIDGLCKSAGDHAPANYCLSCQPGVDGTGWTDYEGACDDRNLCTPNDHCVAGQCVGDAATCCSTFPESWGPIGSVSSLVTPGETAVVQATCFDYTGDGLGDNGMRSLAGQINGPLADGIGSGDSTALFEFPAGLDFANSVVFPLYGLTGKSASAPSSPSGPQYVDPVSYSGDCLPVNRFVDARIVGGHLVATAPGLWLNGILLDTNKYQFHLTQARLKAQVVSGNGSGVVMSGGVVSGVILKSELEATLAAMRAECDALPAGSKPDFCSYLTVMTSAMALMFDLHEEPDGTFVAKSKEKPGNAGSFCLQFTTVQATIAGMQP